jgi:hypothetical protein
LTSAIVLVQFIIDAEEHWPFSCLLTRFLENFFGFVRQNSYGYELFGSSFQTIERATVAYQVMRELDIASKYTGRDKIGEKVTNDVKCKSDQRIRGVVPRSLLHDGHLELASAQPWEFSHLRH